MTWSGDKGGKWLDDSFFEIASEDGSVMSAVKEKMNTSGTRKSWDKHVKDSTLGLLVGAYPCGTVVLWDELYNSEGISQVHGVVNDFLASVSNKESLKYVI